ncbi:PREDICTED: sugar transporter ERD6-like 2 [Tarenaya hassleriana]|uniref:sugar transporter ERD6-like 2 n=1 Tax=Tarenaya hassleriana TaxID=28532 RepID=UPI00053C57A0|nr:PREDICTED: sugar transporter ERD6-like 2 [Tarenaya hassleriana]
MYLYTCSCFIIASKYSKPQNKKASLCGKEEQFFEFSHKQKAFLDLSEEQRMIGREEMGSGFLKDPLISKQHARTSSYDQDEERQDKITKNQTADKDYLSSSFSSGVLLSTSVAVCGSLCYGCAMSYSSPAQSKIMEELGLSVADYSVFASIMTFGGMITAALSGKIAALIGRRHTMWLSNILCTTGWLGVAFAECALLLYMGRLFLGLGVGLVSYVVPVYIAEITPKNIRGGFTFSNQLLQSFGISIMFFVGNFIHWRTLAILSAIPCAVQAIGLFFIPESPRWLAMYGRDRELESTLQRLRGKNADVLEEAADIREAVEISKRESRAGIRDLFQMKYAYSLTIGLGLMLLQQLCGSSAISSYAAHIFDKAGFPSDVGTTIIAAIMVPKSLVVLLTVDRWGRRPLLLASSIGLCICSFLIGLSIHLQRYGEFEKLCSVVLIVGIMGYVAAFAIGLGGLPWVIMSEIFPANVKVTAGSLVTVANWFFSWIIIYTFNFMMQWSGSGTYFIFSGVSFATIVFVWTLVPETKCRTLEEIQASLVR